MTWFASVFPVGGLKPSNNATKDSKDTESNTQKVSIVSEQVFGDRISYKGNRSVLKAHSNIYDGTFLQK